MQLNLKFVICAVLGFVATFPPGDSNAQSGNSVTNVGSPIVQTNTATVTQTGGPNTAVVQQVNAGQIGAAAGWSGSVVNVDSPLVQVNFANVTQVGGASAAEVQQSNLGIIGIGSIFGPIHW